MNQQNYYLFLRHCLRFCNTLKWVYGGDFILSVLSLCKKLTASVGILMLSVAVSFAAVKEHHFPCGPAGKIMYTLMQSGYAYMATAVMNPDIVVQFYLNQRGDWQVIGVDNDVNACVLLHGYDWGFAIVRAG